MDSIKVLAEMLVMWAATTGLSIPVFYSKRIYLCAHSVSHLKTHIKILILKVFLSHLFTTPFIPYTYINDND